MLLLSLIGLLLLVLLISFFPINRTILVATFLLPFQQAFTLNVAGTVRVSDLLYVSALIGIIFKKLYPKLNYNLKLIKGLSIKILFKKLCAYLKTNIGVVYFAYLALGSVVVGFLLRSDIQIGLATLGDYNKSRLLVNVLTPLIALMIFIIGNYSGNQDEKFFQRILRVWAKALMLLSIYVIAQFIVLNIIGVWIKMPGEVLNYGTSFAYGIRRPWGFSIEPGALGSFLVFSNLMVFVFLKKSVLKKKTIIISSIATLLSFSSIAIFAIMTLWIYLIFMNWNKLKKRNKVFIILLVCLSIIIALTNNTIFDATIGKIFVENTSKNDRQGNIQILIKMFMKYPLFGVGAGNFGALRNLFLQGTSLPIKNFYDITNVFYYGMLGEQGIFGTILFVIFAKQLWRSAKTIGKSPLLWLLPLAVLIFTTSTIALDYMAFGFGLVIGQYQHIKNVTR